MAVRKSALLLVGACCSAAACRQRWSLRPTPTSRRATRSCSPMRPTRRRRFRRPISATSSTITAPKRRARSWSIPMRAISITCCPNRKAIRYGVTVGEDALSFWGIAKVGRKEEWPSWVPTADIKRRMPDVPDRVEGGAAQSARRARHLSVPGQQGHAVPHPRHQPAGIYRAGDLLGLHPHDQRGRDRPLQSREDGRDRGGAGAAAGRLARINPRVAQQRRPADRPIADSMA